MLQFNLPYPPSVNHYYVRTKKGMAIGIHGKAYRRLIHLTLRGCIFRGIKFPEEPLAGDLKVDIIIYPPDKRKRDIDNIKKALFDALQHAGLYKDDCQIVEDHTIKTNKVIKGGMIDFRIQKLDGAYLFCEFQEPEEFLKEFSL